MGLEMSNGVPVSRRQLLAGVVGVGALGAVGSLSGARTQAYLSATESFSGAVVAGDLSIDIGCTGCTEDNGIVSFTIDDIQPGDRIAKTLTVTVGSNPGRLWVATDCPEPADVLAQALRVELRSRIDGYTRSLYGGDGTKTLSDLRTTAINGLAIESQTETGCLDPAQSAEIELRLRLPPGTSESLADQSTQLRLLFAAEQCRHNSAQTASNPFAIIDRCAPIKSCPPENCTLSLGKVDISDGMMPIEIGDTLELDNSSYKLIIEDVEQKDNDTETVAVQFTIDSTNGHPTPSLCGVDIKGGGRPTQQGGDGVESYRIDPPSRSTNELLYSSVNSGGNLSGISYIEVFVCKEYSNGDDGVTEPEEPAEPGCVPCREGAINSERISTATFEYTGPTDDVTIVFEPQNSSGGQVTTIESATISSSDAFSIDFPESGNPNFDVSVQSNGAKIQIGSIHTSCSRTFALENAETDYQLTVTEAIAKGGKLVCSEDLQ